MNEQLKYASGWINTVMILIAFGGVFFYWGEVKLLLFDSARQKIETVDHPAEVEEILKEVRAAAAIKKRDADHAIKSRAKRDSLFQEQVRINNLNAIQIEKGLRQNDSLLKKWDEYNKSTK